MDAGRRARLLAHPLPARHPADRGPRAPARAGAKPNEDRHRRQDRFRRPARAPLAGAARERGHSLRGRRARSPPRSSTTRAPTTRWSSPAAARPRSSAATSSSARSATARRLFGYSGHLPEKVAVGDVLQVLNMGGVIGVCDSINASFGAAVRGARAGRGARLPLPRRAHRRAGPGRRGEARLRARRSIPRACRSWRSPAPA